MNNTAYSFNTNYSIKAGISFLFLISVLTLNIYFKDLSHGFITSGLLFMQAILIWRKTLPNFYLIFIPLVVILYMFGSKEILNLYSLVSWYDKIVHFLMEFMLTLLVGSILLKKYNFYYQHHFLFFITIISFGITFGAVWEIIEWFITLVIPPTFTYTVIDTIGDLIIDSYGVFMASLLHLFRLKK